MEKVGKLSLLKDIWEGKNRLEKNTQEEKSKKKKDREEDKTYHRFCYLSSPSRRIIENGSSIFV